MLMDSIIVLLSPLGLLMINIISIHMGYQLGILLLILQLPTMIVQDLTIYSISPIKSAIKIVIMVSTITHPPLSVYLAINYVSLAILIHSVNSVIQLSTDSYLTSNAYLFQVTTNRTNPTLFLATLPA